MVKDVQTPAPRSGVDPEQRTARRIAHQQQPLGTAQSEPMKGNFCERRAEIGGELARYRGDRGEGRGEEPRVVAADRGNNANHNYACSAIAPGFALLAPGTSHTQPT